MRLFASLFMTNREISFQSGWFPSKLTEIMGDFRYGLPPVPWCLSSDDQADPKSDARRTLDIHRSASILSP